MSKIFLGDIPNVKFYEKPSVGSRRVPCGRTDIRTVTSVLVVDLCNGFAIAPKNPAYCYTEYEYLYVSHHLTNRHYIVMPDRPTVASERITVFFTNTK
jgi:hypothetical protein